MAKVLKVSKNKDADKAFDSAKKAMAKLGIPMTLKKPDADKLEKDAKGADVEYEMNDQNGKLKLTAKAGGTKVDVATYDPRAEKLEKQIAVLEALNAQGFDFKAELKAAKAELAGPAIDHKLLKATEKEMGEIEKRVKVTQLEQTKINKLNSLSDVIKDKTFVKEVQAYAKKTLNMDSLNFLVAVAKKTDAKKMIATYIQEGAPQEINIDQPLRDAIVAGSRPPSDAAGEVNGLFNSNVIQKWKVVRTAEIKKEEAGLKTRYIALVADKNKALGKD